MLKPGGVLVWHGGSRDGVMARSSPATGGRRDDGTLIAHERSFDPLSGVLTIALALERARSGSGDARASHPPLHGDAPRRAVRRRGARSSRRRTTAWRDRPLTRRSSEMLLVARKSSRSTSSLPGAQLHRRFASRRPLTSHSPIMRPIRVLVAKPGLDGHDRGAKVVAAALRDAGMEVIYTGLHQTPEMIATAAVQEDVDVVGLSILSGAHMTLFPRVRELLREQGRDDILITGGGIIPKEDMDALQAQGIGKLFGPGTPTTDLIDYIQRLVRRARSSRKRDAVTTRLRELSAEVRALEARLREGGGARQDRSASTSRESSRRASASRGSAIPDTRFLEIGLLVAYDQYDGQAPGAGVVTGIGIVHGREVVVVANDATVKAGSWWPETIKKILRAQEIAMRCRIPIVYLVDSAGVNLPYQGGVFPGQYGASRHLLLQLDHAALPAHSAARRGDGAVHRRRRVPARALRPDRDGEGHVVHGTRRPEPREGRHRPDDRRRDARRRGARTPRSAASRTTRSTTTRRASRSCASSSPMLPAPSARRARERADAERARSRPTTLVRPPAGRPPHVVRHARSCSRAIVDDGKLDEFQGDLAQEMICGDARIDGHPGRRHRQPARPDQGTRRARSRASAASSTPRARRRSRSSSTAATAQGIPLLFVQDVSGFMVGPEAEHEGIIRAGARFVEAMATARVPKIVLTVNHASGAGYYAMAGQGFDPDFIFSWPTGRMAVMEGESAVQAVHGPAIEARSATKQPLADRRRGVDRRDARRLRAPARRAVRRRARLHRRDRLSRGHARRARAGAARVAAQSRAAPRRRSCFPHTSTTHDADIADDDRIVRVAVRAGLLGRLARGAAAAGRGRADRLPDARLPRRSHDVASCRSRRSATRTWATRATSSARWRACCPPSPNAACASSRTPAA